SAVRGAAPRRGSMVAVSSSRSGGSPVDIDPPPSIRQRGAGRRRGGTLGAMVPRFARPELEAPLARVARRVDESIAGLLPYGRSPLWKQAIDATVALSRATTHLLRAQLVLLGSLAGGGPPEGEAPERFAAGLELLHLFMLVHDDVMDNATLR